MSEVVRVLRHGGREVEVAGATEVARMLGVSRQRLYQLLEERPDLPRPITRDPEALWGRQQIDAWASQETRRPGKPLPLPHRLAKEDLRHIPRGERGSPQNVFRDVYVIERLHGWKDHGSAQKALHDALEYMHKDHPDYPFRYDEAWFESRSGDAKEEHDR